MFFGTESLSATAKVFNDPGSTFYAKRIFGTTAGTEIFQMSSEM